MLPATILSPSNVRTFHEESESMGLIRDTSELLLVLSNKVSNTNMYDDIIHEQDYSYLDTFTESIT